MFSCDVLHAVACILVLGRLLLRLPLASNSTIRMLVIRTPFLGVKVWVSIVGSIPHAVLEGIGCHLECWLREIILALFVLELNRAESNMIARSCAHWRRHWGGLGTQSRRHNHWGTRAHC